MPNTLTEEDVDTLTEEAEYSDRRGWTLLLEDVKHSERRGWALSPKRLNTLTEEAGHSHRRFRH